MADGAYAIVVALSNPETADQLVRTASDLARSRGGRIHAVAVEHKPLTSPFLVFSDEHLVEEFSGNRRAVLDRAAEAASVPVTTEIRVDSDVAGALEATIREQDADALLVGWRGDRDAADIVLGKTIDPLLRRTPCDVLVERVGATAGEVDRVLVPTVEGPHLPLAVEAATAIARSNDATVTVLSIVAPGTATDDRAAAERIVTETGNRFEGVAVERAVVVAEDVPDAIVDAAAGHDVLVLGATREGIVRPTVVGSVAREVGSRIEMPVLIAKRRGTTGVLDRVVGRVLS